MELWDAYYADGTLAGQDLVRGEPIPEGLFHIVSEVLVQHVDGDFLLMQRAFTKPLYYHIGANCFSSSNVDTRYRI